MFGSKDSNHLTCTRRLSWRSRASELLFLLINRSVTKSVFDLIGDSASQIVSDTSSEADSLLEQLDFSISSRPFRIDHRFLDRPSELRLVGDVQYLVQTWLEGLGVSTPSASAIAGRFPSYFTYALHKEWRRNAKSYRSILEALETPFAKPATANGLGKNTGRCFDIVLKKASLMSRSASDKCMSL